MRAIEYLFEQWAGSGGVGEWWHRSLCAQIGGDEWFPEKGGSTRSAKSTCHRCPVRAECLDYAITNDERFGVWGALSVEERDREAARRRQDSEQDDWTAAA